MTIQNPEKFVAGLWDWGMLDPCFPGKIKVTDIDGLVERKGHFLVLETKSPGVTIPLGQEIMFKRLQQSRMFTVVVVWGKTNQPQEMQIFYPNGLTSEKKPADMEMFKKVVSWWNTQVELQT